MTTSCHSGRVGFGCPSRWNTRAGAAATAMWLSVFWAVPAAAQGDSEEARPSGPPPVARSQAAVPIAKSPSVTAVRGDFAGRPLTIDDAVSVALAVSPALAQAGEAVMQARGVTTQAKSALGLSASLSYALTRNNEAQKADLGGQSLILQKQYVSQFLGTVGLPLDVTGALHAATSQAHFQELAARAEVSRVRNQVVLDVRRAFYEVLRRHALVSVAESNVNSAETQVAEAQVRLSVGTVTRLDVLSAQAALSAAQQGLRQSRTALSRALAVLRNTMGVDVNATMEITSEGAVEAPTHAAAIAPSATGADDAGLRDQVARSPAVRQRPGDRGAAQAGLLRAVIVGDPAPTGAEFDALLREARAKRPEIAREDAQVAAAQKGVTGARSGAWPSLHLSYHQSYSPDVSGLSSQTLTGAAMLSVNVPLFDAGATRGRVQQAQARVVSAETARRIVVDAVALEVRQAWQDLELYRGQVGVAREQLAQADEACRLAQGRYSAGLTAQPGISPLLELSSAQRALIEAQSAYVNALYDHNAGRSVLDKALGRYSGAP